MGCETNLYGLPGAKECRSGNEFNMYAGLIFATEDQQFASKTAAGLQSGWNTDIAAKKLFVVPLIKNIEDASKEAVKQEFDSGDEVENRSSRRGFKAWFNLTLDAHKILRTYQDKFKYFYVYDEKGNIFGTSPDGTIFKGRTIASLQVHNLTVGLGSAKPLSSLTLIEQFSSELDDDGAVVQPYKLGDAADRWFPSELQPVALATVTQIGSIAANAFVVEVKYKSTSETDAGGDPVTNNGIAGLDVVNVEVLNGSGVAVTPTSVTEVSGYTDRYTVTCPATFTDGSFRVKPTATILVETRWLTLT